MPQNEFRSQGSHNITLEQAVDMTTLYRENRISILKPEYQSDDILALNETFNGADVAALLSQSGCVGFRIYYGMSPDLKVHAILVGVDDQGSDMLPLSESNPTNLKEEVGGFEGIILEDSQRCPMACPPDSVLNLNP
jgi:hypothetical protein